MPLVRVEKISKNDTQKNKQCTIGYGGSGIMAKKFGVFCTKICYFIEENKTQNGLLVFRTVLCS